MCKAEEDGVTKENKLGRVVLQMTSKTNMRGAQNPEGATQTSILYHRGRLLVPSKVEVEVEVGCFAGYTVVTQ